MPAKNEQPQVLMTMPNSVEAEQSILCCILRDETFQADIIAQLHEDDFYQSNHKLIFKAMEEISSTTHKSGEENKADSVNITSLIDALRRKGQLSQVGDIDYIARLNDFLPGTANYDEYLSIVIRASKMRKLIAICGEVDKKARSLSRLQLSRHQLSYYRHQRRHQRRRRHQHLHQHLHLHLHLHRCLRPHNPNAGQFQTAMEHIPTISPGGECWHLRNQATTETRYTTLRIVGLQRRSFQKMNFGTTRQKTQNQKDVCAGIVKT